MPIFVPGPLTLLFKDILFLILSRYQGIILNDLLQYQQCHMDIRSINLCSGQKTWIKLFWH